jgi:hypothetical protein
VAGVRRAYFIEVQKRVPSTHVVSVADLPPKTAEVAGIAWLPRILAKARAKLRGEMDPQIMYGCGGDRAFLKRVDVHPAEFLRKVWEAGENDQKVIDWITRCG